MTDKELSIRDPVFWALIALAVLCGLIAISLPEPTNYWHHTPPPPRKPLTIEEIEDYSP